MVMQTQKVDVLIYTGQLQVVSLWSQSAIENCVPSRSCLIALTCCGIACHLQAVACSTKVGCMALFNGPLRTVRQI